MTTSDECALALVHPCQFFVAFQGSGVANTNKRTLIGRTMTKGKTYSTYDLFWATPRTGTFHGGIRSWDCVRGGRLEPMWSVSKHCVQMLCASKSSWKRPSLEAVLVKTCEEYVSMTPGA
jgi:hypothetical protein